MELQHLLHRANVVGLQQFGRRSRRYQSRRYVLRSQLGFRQCTNSKTKPKACTGCMNYHGIAYGQRQGQRTRLICAIYPYGWTVSDTCPDWIPETGLSDKP